MTQYLVWSDQHRMWWRHGGAGYTPHVSEAGRFTRTQAVAICCRALPGQWSPGRPFPETPIAEADALELDAEGRRTLAKRIERRAAK